MKPANIISLTTDFGLRDGYVAQIKGSILKNNFSARIIDISHEVPAHDILCAAVLIKRSYSYLPPGTTHLIVVDPGVGSQRRILAVEADGHFFIAPDNGSLCLVLDDQPQAVIHCVEKKSLFASDISTTFHGRDIMAPIAAELAGGMSIDNTGPRIFREQCVFLAGIKPVRDENKITGQVLQIDRFGNIRTNISILDLKDLPTDNCLHIVCNGYIIKGINQAYFQQRPGELLALIDSNGYLELAVNQGNAARYIDCKVLDPLTIQW